MAIKIGKLMQDILDIDSQINNLLEFLSKMQNSDGSFDSYYLQPYYNPEKGWMKYPTNLKTAFDIASISIPLCFMSDVRSERILVKSIKYLRKISLCNKFWSYSSLSKEHLVPFDIDSTALASYVISQRFPNIINKELFKKNLDSNSNYKLWIKTSLLYRFLPIIEKIKLFKLNYYIKRNIQSRAKLIREDDNELAINCNVLLYIGDVKETKLTWDKVEKEVFENKFDESFYINDIHSFYIFSRLVFYGGRNLSMKSQIAEVLNRLLGKLKGQNIDRNFYYLLLSNSILFLEIEIEDKYESIISTCYQNLKTDYNTNYPYYSSSLKNDSQPGTNLPNTYFGSPAITSSLYLEFLNLYRKRFYGKYYGA